MVSFYKKFFFFKIRETWFSYEFKISDLFTLNAYLAIRNFKQSPKWGIKVITYSIENSLVEDADVIFSRFSTTTRKDIKRAERAGIECCFFNDIDRFVDFYNSFAKIKNIPGTSRQRMEEMGEYLKMSCALLNGQLLQVHSYLIDNELKIVGGYSSASLRFDSTVDYSLVSKANKLLHYKDMLYFKDQGFRLYDFGGYTENTTDESLIGINEFKLSFGGQKTESLNIVSFNYYILKGIRKFLIRLNRYSFH